MKEETLQELQADSYLSGGNADYIEELYKIYLKDPSNVSAQWRNYFQNLPKGDGAANQEVSQDEIRQYFMELEKQDYRPQAVSVDADMERKQAQVAKLIQNYRTMFLAIVP